MSRYGVVMVSEPQPCCRCDSPVALAGEPAGWDFETDGPVCDRCMLRLAPPLGLWLSICILAREIGEAPVSAVANQLSAIHLLLKGFARKSGPVGPRALHMVEEVELLSLGLLAIDDEDPTN